MKTLWILLLFALGPTVALAGEITHEGLRNQVIQAKKEGKICEDGKGYLVAKDPSTESLVSNVNDKRKMHYERIAKSNSKPNKTVTPQAVASEAVVSHPHLQKPPC